MPSRNVGPALFALVCLAMAIFHEFVHKLDSLFIGLVLLAAVPWFVPWIIPLLSSLKVGGLELNFRDLKAQVDANTQMTQATAAAVMPVVKQAVVKAAKAAASEYVSHGVPLSPGVAQDESDPNKGDFGGSRERDGFRLGAQVTPVPQSTEYFLIHAWVEPAAAVPCAMAPRSCFTFTQASRNPWCVTAAAGAASIDRLGWGAFTIGVEVEGVRLELDLHRNPSAPPLFRSR